MSLFNFNNIITEAFDFDAIDDEVVAGSPGIDGMRMYADSLDLNRVIPEVFKLKSLSGFKTRYCAELQMPALYKVINVGKTKQTEAMKSVAAAKNGWVYVRQADLRMIEALYNTPDMTEDDLRTYMRENNIESSYGSEASWAFEKFQKLRRIITYDKILDIFESYYNMSIQGLVYLMLSPDATYYYFNVTRRYIKDEIKEEIPELKPYSAQLVVFGLTGLKVPENCKAEPKQTKRTKRTPVDKQTSLFNKMLSKAQLSPKNLVNSEMGFTDSVNGIEQVPFAHIWQECDDKGYMPYTCPFKNIWKKVTNYSMVYYNNDPTDAEYNMFQAYAEKLGYELNNTAVCLGTILAATYNDRANNLKHIVLWKRWADNEKCLASFNMQLRFNHKTPIKEAFDFGAIGDDDLNSTADNMMYDTYLHTHLSKASVIPIVQDDLKFPGLSRWKQHENPEKLPCPYYFTHIFNFRNSAPARLFANVQQQWIDVSGHNLLRFKVYLENGCPKTAEELSTAITDYIDTQIHEPALAVYTRCTPGEIVNTGLLDNFKTLSAHITIEVFDAMLAELTVGNDDVLTTNKIDSLYLYISPDGAAWYGMSYFTKYTSSWRIMIGLTGQNIPKKCLELDKIDKTKSNVVPPEGKALITFMGKHLGLIKIPTKTLQGEYITFGDGRTVYKHAVPCKVQSGAFIVDGETSKLIKNIKGYRLQADDIKRYCPYDLIKKMDDPNVKLILPYFKSMGMRHVFSDEPFGLVVVICTADQLELYAFTGRPDSYDAKGLPKRPQERY